MYKLLGSVLLSFLQSLLYYVLTLKCIYKSTNTVIYQGFLFVVAVVCSDFP